MILHHSSHLTINLSGPQPLSFLLHTDNSFLSNRRDGDDSWSICQPSTKIVLFWHEWHEFTSISCTCLLYQSHLSFFLSRSHRCVLNKISSKGCHREIAEHINQSDYFDVFHQLLVSEVTMIGKVGVGSHEDLGGLNTSNTIRKNLQKICMVTAYTYLHSMKTVQDLIQCTIDTATEESDNVKKQALLTAVLSGSSSRKIWKLPCLLVEYWYWANQFDTLHSEFGAHHFQASPLLLSWCARRLGNVIPKATNIQRSVLRLLLWQAVQGQALDVFYGVASRFLQGLVAIDTATVRYFHWE